MRCRFSFASAFLILTSLFMLIGAITAPALVEIYMEAMGDRDGG
jgi:hypothetical protein